MVPRKERSFDKLLHILEHPIRRRILESLREKDLSYDELTRICSNHGRLGYHLRQMCEIVKRVPKEKMYRLTQSGRVAWDWYAQAPSPNARGDLEPAPVHVAYANQLGLNEHAFALYEGAKSRRAIAFPFLARGLTRSMASIYIVSEKEMDAERKEMRRRYIGMEEFEERGAFTIMSAEEWYMRRGKASSPVIIDNWSKLIQEKMSQGYKGLQLAADMNVFFENSKASELLAYEKEIGRNFPKSMCAICMYDSHRVDSGQVTSLIGSHGHGIFL
jgi:DNA-binding transcriptional ArsR family regulator